MSSGDDKTKAQFKQHRKKYHFMYAMKTQKKDEDEEGKWSIRYASQRRRKIVNLYDVLWDTNWVLHECKICFTFLQPPTSHFFLPHCAPSNERCFSVTCHWWCCLLFFARCKCNESNEKSINFQHLSHSCDGEILQHPCSAHFKHHRS